MTFAIVPAAGHSTRMGCSKLLLPLGDRTLLEHVIATLWSGGVGHVLVVTSSHVPELSERVVAAGAEVVVLTEPTADMRSTVERGLDWLESRFNPSPLNRWLLTPGDHPAIDVTVVQQLLAESSKDAIVIPTCAGRRGHPTRFTWSHVAAIRALPRGDGINAFLRDYPNVVELPVADPGILVDVDTPADYAKVAADFKD